MTSTHALVQTARVTSVILPTACDYSSPHSKSNRCPQVVAPRRSCISGGVRLGAGAASFHVGQVIVEFTRQLGAGQALNADQVAVAVSALADERGLLTDKAAFLTALAKKGETADEIAAFARELRNRSVQLPLPADFRAGQEVLDVCGTGGDRLNTFNISTTVALVCAAAEVVVAKHGNRAITSQSGSADVLEALGISIDLEPAAAAESLQRHGFVFLFAPKFHPSFKGIGPARRLCAEQGQRTIFNFLGPLWNPVRPTAQLLGVSRPELTEPMARTLQVLGLRRAIVVAGEVPTPDGTRAHLDEFSTLGENTVAEFYQDRALSCCRWSPADLPLAPATLADLAGGDAQTNAGLIKDLLCGELMGPKLEAVLLNAGAALFVAGRARSIAEGWKVAEETIRSGAAAKKLRALQGST